jgi:hypothetical protein
MPIPAPLHEPASPHQKRPIQRATNAIEFKEKDRKSTNLIDILPLITVWLQVRRFPNRQLNQ